MSWIDWLERVHNAGVCQTRTLSLAGSRRPVNWSNCYLYGDGLRGIGDNMRPSRCNSTDYDVMNGFYNKTMLEVVPAVVDD